MGRLRVGLVLALIVVAGCGGDAAPATSSVTSTTPQSTSTQTSTVATTAAPPTTSTILPPAADSLFVVTGVAADDVLDVRDEPSASCAIIGSLAPGAGVRTTGNATSDVVDAGWWEVTLDDGATGWVDRRFVALRPEYASSLSTSPCGSVTDTPTTSPAASSDADHVLAVAFESGAECDRVVLMLGAEANGDWPERLADTVPDGITVSVEGTVAVISFPAENASVDRVRPTAVDASFGDVKAFVARSFPSNDDPLNRGAPEVRIHFGRNVALAAAFLSDPARIVVDAYPAPTGTGLDLAPVIGDGTVLEHPVEVDLAGPGVRLPVTVTGYGRPFEAQGVAELRTVGPAPGSGEPVEAVFSGPSGTVDGSTYPFMTTDWTEMWGRFTFTLDGLEPGTYELFVGEYSATDGTPIGVYDTFTVVG